MTTNEKLDALRSAMREAGIDVYLIPSQDAHQSEYVADYWRARAWASGFTGSAGTLVITQEKACLWADGRYHIQAEKQVAGSRIELFKDGLAGVPTLNTWLAENVAAGSVVGFDGRTVSHDAFERYCRLMPEASFRVADLVSGVWTDRPALPKAPVEEMSLAFAGESRADKLGRVRSHLNGKKADYLMLASLDDIAWTLNLRGGDILHTPVFYAYLLVGTEKAWLFAEEEKFDETVRASLAADGVELCPYDSLPALLPELSAGTVVLAPGRINETLYKAVPSGWKILPEPDCTTYMKACKNPVERQNIREAHVKDGVAMVRFIKWLKEHVGKPEPVDEWEAGEYLDHLRLATEGCFDLSFGTIAGYMENGASAHYSAKKGEAAVLRPEGMIVVDSGGQYRQGTTDITRTIVLGPVTDRMKFAYTLVLKGHLALARAKFLEKTSGHYLDILARQFLWQHGMDYRHGTGHGVGYVLSVHEGPQNIGRGPIQVPLEVGMVISDEPGYYPEGEFGVRIENLVMVKEAETTVDGRFLEFETLALCPYDKAAIDWSLITPEEKAQIDAYHTRVYETLAPYLSEEERTWLALETKA